MTDYVEEFEVPGIGNFAIRDHECPGDSRLFQKDGMRYTVWLNGSWGAPASTMDEARRLILERIRVVGCERKSNLIRTLDRLDRVLRVVDTDPPDAFRLARFLVIKEDEG